MVAGEIQQWIGAAVEGAEKNSDLVGGRAQLDHIKLEHHKVHLIGQPARGEDDDSQQTHGDQAQPHLPTGRLEVGGRPSDLE